MTTYVSVNPGPAARSDEILIVGAGPVGLSLACDLFRLGVPCRIVDRAPQRAQSSRATDIHARSLEIFDQLGVLDRLLAMGKQVRGFNAYSEGRAVSSFEYEGLESRYPFTLALGQADTEAVLEQRLVELGGALERRTELVELQQDAAGATAMLRRADGAVERARFRYVVACDGVRSSVRRLLDIPFAGITYGRKYLVGDFDIDWAHASDQVHLFMSGEGFCNVLALPGSRTRGRILCDLPAGDERPADAASFRALVRRRARTDVRLASPGLGASFRIQRRLAPQYRYGAVFLAGDAAHVCSPLLGQGMNTGLQDAHDLAWKLALVCRGAARPALLDTYERDRRPIAAGVLRDTHALHVAATMRSSAPSRVRDLAFATVTRSALARRFAGARCSELGNRYGTGAGPIARGLEALRAAVARVPDGARLPNVPTAGDQPWWLHDLLDASRYTLLVLQGSASASATAQTALDELADGVVARFGRSVAVQRVRVEAAPLASRARERWGLPWGDVDGAVHRRMGASRPTLVLVRPDAHVAFSTRRLDAAALAARLERLVAPGANDTTTFDRAPIAEIEHALTAS